MLIHLQYDSFEVGNKLKEEYKLDDPVIKGIMAANMASHEAVVTAYQPRGWTRWRSESPQKGTSVT